MKKKQMEEQTEEKTEEKELSFQKLTPFVDVALGGYQEAFEFVFKNEDVCNVAITGDYGIGKSSLIRSYEKKNKRKFLYISLMHIEYNNAENFNNEVDRNVKLDEDGNGLINSDTSFSQNNNLIDDAVIEKKLINQLVQCVPHNKIPYTSFSVKRNDCRIKYAIWSLLTVAFLAASIFTFNYNRILPIIDYWINISSDKNVIAKLSLLKGFQLERILLLYIIVYLFVLLYKIFTYFSYRNGLFKNVSVNINNVEMRLKGDKQESFFDDHLDDILYMFANLDVDAVIFEDIERFKNFKIFEQLREINDLVNKRINNRKVGLSFLLHRKTVRFFYLVHDNMFSGSNMVKFFDFIIPVIPALHVKNSYQMLQRWFNKYTIDDNVLERISLHIYDYWTVKSS